jgi:hypothetical protein
MARNSLTICGFSRNIDANTLDTTAYYGYSIVFGNHGH